jgi:methyltransferase
VTGHTLLLGYVVLARLVELSIARRNTRRLLAQGGYEVGRKHYPLIVAMHAAWILTIAFAVPPATPVAPHFLLLFVITQGLRYWVIGSLGARWTTRIIVVPGASLVKHGPYRWLRHPNYLVVVAEIALLPLVFGAWQIALGFSVINAVVLWHRVRIEDAALGFRAEVMECGGP